MLFEKACKCDIEIILGGPQSPYMRPSELYGVFWGENEGLLEQLRW